MDSTKQINVVIGKPMFNFYQIWDFWIFVIVTHVETPICKGSEKLALFVSQNTCLIMAIGMSLKSDYIAQLIANLFGIHTDDTVCVKVKLIQSVFSA